MAGKYRYTKKAIEKRRKWLDELKNQPCARCGNIYPSYVMDWHHIYPSMKKFCIGRGSFRHGKKEIADEIKKCRLYCANCHRIIEFEERFPQRFGK